MLNSLLLEAVSTRANVPQFILLGGIFAVFYLFMIRPQQRRQKEQRNFLEKMKKGSPVVTIGGIHGKIHEVADATVTLEVDNKGTKMIFSKGAISLDSTKQHTAKK